MYRPDQKTLKKYADVLIKFALNGGEGVKKGEVVVLGVPESAKALLWELQTAVLESGAHYLVRFAPDGEDRRTMGGRLFFELASDEQLNFFPDKYLKGLIDQSDHWVSILADEDPNALDGIENSKIMKKQSAMKPFMKWRNEKEHAGKFTWTLALFGTPAMAKEAGLSLEDYWHEIIQACYLDTEDPIAEWKKLTAEIHRVQQILNEMKIKKLHVEAEDTDLWITMGEGRKWLGGGGRNIPSFEIFTSPDARFTEGSIRFNQPLYLYGQKAEGIRLWFEKGRVVKIEAKKGQPVLEEMIKVKDADRVGEFSLTDGRISRITKFMANTLFDENVGGPQGNTHLALGMSYKDTYTGDLQGKTDEAWEKLGYNDSVVHTDIMSTTERKVTAILEDGSQKVIYESGKFLV